jgi:hypothetical protein
MISSEFLGFLLLILAIFGFCIFGYIFEYARFVVRFYHRYGVRVLSRGIRYIKRL